MMQGSVVRWFRVWGMALTLSMLPLLGWAQLLDRIDIRKADNETEITVRFNVPIQYVRHAPQDESKFLRIFIRVTDPGFAEENLTQATVQSPQSPWIPRFTVMYPEIRNGLLVTFDKSTRYVVHQGEDGRSVIIHTPLPLALNESPKPLVKRDAQGHEIAGVPQAVTAPPPSEPLSQATTTANDEAQKMASAPVMSALELEKIAERFLTEAREAHLRKDMALAINRLNRILGMPRSSFTESAQALIGEVREDSGEYAKAKAEYELYLKLYPKGHDSKRVRDRLAALPAEDTAKRAAALAKSHARDSAPAEWTANGSLSSYYYSGSSSFNDGPTVKDQSTLMSTVNLSARLRDGPTDTRFVYRDSHNMNELAPSRNYDRVYALYGERSDRETGYFVRAGRQNPNGSGVMERFDGVTGNYSVTPDWRVGAVSGTAVEFNVPYSKNFYGANLEWVGQPGRPGVNAYYIQQNVDGFLSRRAVGSELRYFDGGFNTYGMLDYDTLYKGVNIVMVQANYMDGSGNNYYGSFDRRRSPTLGLLNGLMLPVSAGATDVAGMVAASGMEQVRTTIEEGTPTADMFSLGMTHPLTDKWQIGGDLRMSSISGVNAVVPLSQICDINSVNEANGTCLSPAGVTIFISALCSTWSLPNNTCIASQQASGQTRSFTLQAIGSNLFSPNAVGVGIYSLTQGPTYTGQSVSFSYIFPFLESWRLESNLRFYAQSSETGETQDRSSPSFKLAYQWQSKFFIETEVGSDSVKSVAADATQTSTRRDYVYVGVRRDFR